MEFKILEKPRKGDRVAILSPSFAAPGKWPAVYQLGLQRLQDIFGLAPVEYPTTSKLGASGDERARDIVAAFADRSVKAVISTLGGDDQITYITKYLPAQREVFQSNPKPFFGYSDCTHLINFLWLNGVPSFYGGTIFTEFAMQGSMDDFTVAYLQKALFETGRIELTASPEFNDEGLNWNDSASLEKRRRYQANEGWYWDGEVNAEGITWGGCIESIDELLRHAAPIPTLEQFEQVVLFFESSEELPPAAYVYRVFRALGERGILRRVKGVLVGRPKAWEFDKRNTDEQKAAYKQAQRNAILGAVRQYNPAVPVVQNLDLGHTAPQIPLPVGMRLTIDAQEQKIFIEF